MRHFKDPDFHSLFEALPANIRRLANRNFELLKKNPKHPSLHFKRIRNDLWSVRVGLGHRALESGIAEELGNRVFRHVILPRMRRNVLRHTGASRYPVFHGTSRAGFRLAPE